MAGFMRIEGDKELKRTLKTVSPAEANRIAKRTVTVLARRVRDVARGRAPVDEGNLKRATKSRRARGSRDEAAAEVWVDRSGGRSGQGQHWHLVEFGARGGNMPAQPFVNPTIEEFRPRMPLLYRTEWWPQYRKEMEKRARKQAARQGR